jgi:hypothetical protein
MKIVATLLLVSTVLAVAAWLFGRPVPPVPPRGGQYGEGQTATGQLVVTANGQGSPQRSAPAEVLPGGLVASPLSLSDSASGSNFEDTAAIAGSDAGRPDQSLTETASSGSGLSPAASLSPEQSAMSGLDLLRGPLAASSVSPPIVVPQGAKLPALFLDERPLPAPQRRFLDRVANEFIDAVAVDPGGQNRALWEAARAEADRQYIKLYGHAAYNALNLQSAKEALREIKNKATTNP